MKKSHLGAIVYDIAIAGGSTAGIIETFTAMTRAASTSMTGGTGNFLVATIEALSAGVLSILALTLPLFAAALVIGLLILAIRRLRSSLAQSLGYPS